MWSPKSKSPISSLRLFNRNERDWYHFERSLSGEECLRHHRAAYPDRWADEEGYENSADHHGCVRITLGTSNVENERAESRYQPNGPSAKPIRNRLPENRGKSVHRDLGACEIGYFL